MQYKRTSRRDDLVSMFYMVLFLLNENKFVGFDPSKDKNYSVRKEFVDFHTFRKIKGKFNLSKMPPLVQPKLDDETTFHLEALAKQIEELEFDEKPAYRKIRKTIHRCKATVS